MNLLEIRKFDPGQNSYNFQKRPSKQDAAYSVSIQYMQYEKDDVDMMYGKDMTLDLVFESAEEMKLIIAGIQYIIEDLKDEENRTDLKEEDLMRKCWEEADEDGNNKLDIDEISALMVKLNCNIEKYHLRKTFDFFDADNSGKLDYGEFRNMMAELNHK